MVEWNTADGIFKVLSPERSMEFTGERMTTAIEGEIEFEHFHRYCLARDLCPGFDVLDVASGEGYGSSILATVARNVTGVDVDPAAIAHARTTYPGENLRFVEGSALDLPIGDASVDAVVSFETLEHVREHARFMAEVKRVLRSGGKLIVSTPERAVYSARGEPVNKYHLLELTAAEFDSLLRANFRHVLILSQRAILGSLIVAAEGGGPWRSYERRSLEYIEASAGLTRAPFLVAIASDKELSQTPSSVYLDRRRPGEVIGGYLRLPAYQSQAAEMSAEIKRLSDAAASGDAEIKRLSDAAASGDAEIKRLSDAAASGDAEIKRLSDAAVSGDAEIRSLKRALDARDIELATVKSERDAKIIWFNHEQDAQAAKFAVLQGRFDKLNSIPQMAACRQRGSSSPHCRPPCPLAGCSDRLPQERPAARLASGPGVSIRHDPNCGDCRPDLRRASAVWRARRNRGLGRGRPSGRAGRAVGISRESAAGSRRVRGGRRSAEKDDPHRQSRCLQDRRSNPGAEPYPAVFRAVQRYRLDSRRGRADQPLPTGERIPSGGRPRAHDGRRTRQGDCGHHVQSPFVICDRKQRGIPEGAQAIEGGGCSDSLADPRVFGGHTSSFSVSRRSVAIDQDGVLDKGDA